MPGAVATASVASARSRSSRASSTSSVMHRTKTCGMVCALPKGGGGGGGAAGNERRRAPSSAVPAVSTTAVELVSALSSFERALSSVDEAPTCDRVPRKTHIVCTLGPATNGVEEISQLLHAGMNVARFNFSHGDHEYHYKTLCNLREASAATGITCAVLLDTKGPEIRTGFLEGGEPVHFEVGSRVTLTTDYDIKGNASLIAVSYPYLARDVRPGCNILMADGAVVLRVDSTNIDAGTVECTCMNKAKLGERKNCNLPGVEVDLPTLTEKDVHDLVDFGVKYGVDFIAASFVRKGSDVVEVRRALGEEGKFIRVIAKVENEEGLKNFDDILEQADGIMVARGDLGMEIAVEKIFWVQKMMIRKCNLAGKPVVTATQMLDSMISSPRPTRAEATDVANAVLDGTDCVMLSGETAAGAYPIDSVSTMRSICEEAEKCINNYDISRALIEETLRAKPDGEPMSVIESLASSAVLTAAKVQASLIVVLAANGSASRLISKYRPVQPVVVGVVPRERRAKIGFDERETPGGQIVRQSLLSHGLIPIEVNKKDDSLDPPTAAKRCVEETLEYAKKMGLCKPGDKAVAMYNVERQCAVVRVVDVDCVECKVE